MLTYTNPSSRPGGKPTFAAIAAALLVAILLAGCTADPPTPVMEIESPAPEITHKPAPEPALEANFSWTPTQPTVGERVQFVAEVQSSEPGDKITEAKWDIDGRQFKGGNPGYEFQDAGNYTVTFTVKSEQAGSTIVQREVTIQDGQLGDSSQDTKQNHTEDNEPVVNNTPPENRTDWQNFSAEKRQICQSAGNCDFWDDQFHEYILYNVETTVYDVVIVPPVGIGNPLSYADVARKAVQQWEDGIKALGSPWLLQDFEINIYVVGQDVPSVDAVADPEIIVAQTAAIFLIGIGLEDEFGCIGSQSKAESMYPVHEHGQVKVMAGDCTGAGYTCYALTVGSSSPRLLYDVIAHEVGHCLGVGHVGDALDFQSKWAPIRDIMSYWEDPEQVGCVSTMNVRAFEGLHAPVLGYDQVPHLRAGQFYPMQFEDYYQYQCENP